MDSIIKISKEMLPRKVAKNAFIYIMQIIEIILWKQRNRIAVKFLSSY